jgi:FtsH-binding integral membrane protein
MAKSFMALLRAKRGFLAAVFLTLAVQLAIAFEVMRRAAENPRLQEALSKTLTYVLFLVLPMLALVVLLSFVPMPPAIKFLVFAALSAIAGVAMSRLAKRYGEQVVRVALLSSASIFVAFLVAGFLLAAAGVDLRPLALYLFAALLGLLVASVVMLFVEVPSLFQRILSASIVALFSVYVAFDTNVILQRDYAGDFVQAALDYFLDFINIFQNVAILQGGE